MHLLSLISVLLVFSLSHAGYYWRDYHGTIPSDAIVAGTDHHGVKLYVGQAYHRHHGLINGQILPGTKEIIVQDGGAHKIAQYIKILCSSTSNFKWITTSTGTFSDDTQNLHKVIGGHRDDIGDNYVGRLNFSHQSFVGRIPNTGFYRGKFLGINDAHESVETQEKFEILIHYSKCDVSSSG